MLKLLYFLIGCLGIMSVMVFLAIFAYVFASLLWFVVFPACDWILEHTLFPILEFIYSLL